MIILYTIKSCVTDAFVYARVSCAQQFREMPPRRPHTRRAKYVFMRLKEETHKSWKLNVPLQSAVMMRWLVGSFEALVALPITQVFNSQCDDFIKIIQYVSIRTGAP